MNAPRKTRFVLAVALLSALAAAVGCEPRATVDRRQAILIMLDAARPDRLSCYGYQRPTTPEMDRLAAEGVLFRNHFAQGTATRVSLSSLLYSRYYSLPLFPNSRYVPYSNPAHLFRGPDEQQISFVRALAEGGLKTAAISAHLWTGENTAFAAEFDEMHDLVSRLDDDRPYPSAETVIDYALDWIRDHKKQDYFLYVHLMDPHFPHHFEQDAQAFFGASHYDGNGFGPGGRMLLPDHALTDVDRRYANALYDGSLRYTDRHVGRLVQFLENQGLLARTLILITADHGEHLFDFPGSRTRDGLAIFRHGGPWFEPVARIPLIIHYPPRLDPKRFDHLSEGVDVAPTLLSLLGVPVPSGRVFDGIDLSRVIRGAAPPNAAVFMPGNIRTDRHKCMFSTPDDALLAAAPPPIHELTGSLYDLETDPWESNDLFASKPDVVGRLLRLYRTKMATPFHRFEAARTSTQPRAAFAISARFLESDNEIPEATGPNLPMGWSRRARGSESLLVASQTDEPLTVRCPLPDGPYELSLNLKGNAVIEVGGQQRALSHDGGLAMFGPMVVTGNVFTATIRPNANRPLGVAYFGFAPPMAQGEDEQRLQERLERLKSLGYVND